MNSKKAKKKDLRFYSALLIFWGFSLCATILSTDRWSLILNSVILVILGLVCLGGYAAISEELEK